MRSFIGQYFRLTFLSIKGCTYLNLSSYCFSSLRLNDRKRLNSILRENFVTFFFFIIELHVFGASSSLFCNLTNHLMYFYDNWKLLIGNVLISKLGNCCKLCYLVY